MVVLLILFSGFAGVVCFAVGGVLSAIKRAPAPSLVLLILGTALAVWSGFYIIGTGFAGITVLAVILLFDILFAILLSCDIGSVNLLEINITIIQFKR